MTRDPLAAVRPEIRALRAYRFEPVPKVLARQARLQREPGRRPGRGEGGGARRAAAPAASPSTRSSARRASAPRSRRRSASRPEQVVPSNGSGEAILAAVSVFAGCGGTLLLAPPVFSLYVADGRRSSARSVATVPLVGRRLPRSTRRPSSRAADGGADRPAPLLAEQPDGRDALARLRPPALRRRRASSSSTRPTSTSRTEEDDLLPLLDELPNLVVFRTLSKAYSVAGLRVGFAAARPDVARGDRQGDPPVQRRPRRPRRSPSRPSRGATRSRERCRGSRAERERVAAALRALGAKVAPSRANFLFLVPPGGDGARVFRDLRDRGVLVRDQTAVVPGAPPRDGGDARGERPLPLAP